MDSGARIERLSRQLTSILFLSGVVLVALGTAGMAPSMTLVGPLVLAGALFLIAHELLQYRIPTALVRTHAATLWVGPILAAAVVLARPTLSAGELQAIGGGVGLVAIGNYLVRPAYVWLATGLFGLVSSTADSDREDRSGSDRSARATDRSESGERRSNAEVDRPATDSADEPSPSADSTIEEGVDPADWTRPAGSDPVRSAGSESAATDEGSPAETVSPSSGPATADFLEETTPADAGREAPSADTDASVSMAEALGTTDFPERFREEATDLAAFWAEHDLDYSPASLARLDGFVDDQWDNERFAEVSFGGSGYDAEAFTGIVTQVGSYAGEVLVRNESARWVEGGETGWAVELDGPDRRQIVDVFAIAMLSVRDYARFLATYRELSPDPVETERSPDPGDVPEELIEPALEPDRAATDAAGEHSRAPAAAADETGDDTDRGSPTTTAADADAAETASESSISEVDTTAEEWTSPPGADSRDTPAAETGSADGSEEEIPASEQIDLLSVAAGGHGDVGVQADDGDPSAFAATADRLADRWSAYDLDCSPSSLLRLDAVLAETDDPGTVRELGAYFGEVLSAGRAGRWVLENGLWGVAVDFDGPTAFVNPFEVADQCLESDRTFEAAYHVADGQSAAIAVSLSTEAETLANAWPEYDLDFTISSLGRLDDLANVEFDPIVAEVDGAAIPIDVTDRAVMTGGYFGEVLVRAGEARWAEDRPFGLVVTAGESPTTVNVVTLAANAIRGAASFVGSAEAYTDKQVRPDRRR